MAEQEQAAVSSTARNALVVIAVVVTGAAVYWLSAILPPLALALFLMIMIDSFARVLRRRLKFPAIAGYILAGIADFNRDGFADLAVSDTGSNAVSVLLGKCK